jgi:uncharacterized MAPEG superfamily protein
MGRNMVADSGLRITAMATMGHGVNIPVLVLLGFAAWTLTILVGSIGLYRWRRILTGRACIAEWRADLVQGSEWYQRAMRAHMNCVENLPVYTAIVVALISLEVHRTVIDYLAVTMLVARIMQSIVHIVFPLTNTATGIRFSFYLVQVTCMLAMGGIIMLR